MAGVDSRVEKLVYLELVEGVPCLETGYPDTFIVVLFSLLSG
jgi:hypothetical protein